MTIAEHDDSQKRQTAAVCTVKVDNVEIRYNIISVGLTQEVGKHHELKVEIGHSVGDDYHLENPDEYSKNLGKTISVTIEPIGMDVDKSHSLEFIGTITKISFDNSVDNLNTVSIYAKSPTAAMDGAKVNKYFTEMKASDIISAIAGEYPITIGGVDSTSTNYRHILQHNETDFEFIRRLAGMSGLYTIYDGKEFRVVKAASGSYTDLTFRSDLASFSVDLGTAQPEYQGDTHDYLQSKDLKQKSKNVRSSKSLSNLTGKSAKASKEIFPKSSSVMMYDHIDDAQSLDQALKNVRDSAQSGMVNCSGQSVMPDIKLGKCVKINGLEGFNGQYWVEKITHFLGDGGKYSNTFECTPVEIAHPEYEKYKNRGAQLQHGVVVDNDDPEQLGRIKVKFPWIGEETHWIRYLTPHAGAERGWYVLPEINDEVLVGFENGNPDKPIIIGSVWNGKDKPPGEAYDSKNDVKMFLTKGGNKILIRDEGGKEAIEIVNVDGKNSILMEAAGPDITIKSTGDIAIDGANIKIKGSGDITIEADGNIKGDAGSNMELKAGANMKVEATGTQDVNGAMVNVKGNPINLN